MCVEANAFFQTYLLYQNEYIYTRQTYKVFASYIINSLLSFYPSIRCIESNSLYAGPKRALVFTWVCWSVHTLEQYGLKSPYCSLHNAIHTPARNPAPDEVKHPFTVSRFVAIQSLNFCVISSIPGSTA